MDKILRSGWWYCNCDLDCNCDKQEETKKINEPKILSCDKCGLTKPKRGNNFA